MVFEGFSDLSNSGRENPLAHRLLPFTSRRIDTRNLTVLLAADRIPFHALLLTLCLLCFLVVFVSLLITTISACLGQCRRATGVG